jgi:hypothetical protein
MIAGRAAAPLGTLTESASAVSVTQGTERRWSRHRLAAQVRKALPEHRVCECGQRAVPGQSPRLVAAPGGSVHFAGVRSCGSVWVCPYCAAKVGRARVAELRRALEVARAKGWNVYLATFTVGHGRWDPLPVLLEQLTNAMRRWRGGREWVAFAKRVGYVGSVRNLEVTFGTGTGWHPHSHAVLITRRPLTDEQSAMLARRWRTAVEAWGGYASEEHGLRITGGPEDFAAVDEYLTKEERRIREAEAAERRTTRWGEAEELVYSHVKLGKGVRMSPWMLLRAADQLEVEDEAASWVYVHAFREYAKAFEGRRQLVWSRGLRELLEVGADRSDLEVAEEHGEGTTVWTFTADEWRAVARYRAQPAVLDAYEDGGVGSVRTLVWYLLELAGSGPGGGGVDEEDLAAA